MWNLCEAGAPRAPFGAVLACELEADGSVGAHLQEELAEIVIVVEGEGTACVGGGGPVALSAGSVVEVPKGHTLALANGSSTGVLRYLIVKASAA